MNKARDPRQVMALVGLGLIVPGAKDPARLWDNVLNNRTFFRKARLADFGADPEEFYSAKTPPELDKCYSLYGSWLDGAPGGEDEPAAGDFEGLKLPASFNLNEADPSLLYWLRAVSRALPKKLMAGHDRSEIGVIAGHVVLPTRTMSEATLSLYGREATRNWPLNPFTAPPKTNPFRAVGYSAKLASEALELKGPAFTVDAACASSLYALRLAMAKLREGSLSLVLTGGLAQADPLFTQLGFSQLRALSRSGLSRPFDQNADGLVVGSGAVALAVKRLDRAISDGDEIMAIISGLGLSNDRKGNSLAPDFEGQKKAMEAAFLESGLPSDLAPGLIEAHGTSTPVGDAAEMASIKSFLAGRSCGFAPVVGSIKGNLGHLLSAAGAVSLAKAALALQKAILPPSAGYLAPASGLNLAQEPALRILSKAEAWPEPSQGRARVAVVNAFGFGGINAQAVLEEYRPSDWSLNDLSENSEAQIEIRPETKLDLRGARGLLRANKMALNGAPALGKASDLSAFLISARTVLAPWPNYDALARYWLTPEEPPMAQTRRFGGLKTTGYFFDHLTLNVKNFHLPPKEISEALPQQTLAFKAAQAAVAAAGLDPDHWPEALDQDRVGVFMGVEIDPRSADYALRWLGAPRAALALKDKGLSPEELEKLIEQMRQGAQPPLTRGRVLGALGSFVASRLARFLGLGGPAFTMSEEQDSGLRALREAMSMIKEGLIDLALVGVVDTFGDPKTAALAPKSVWVEGAAAMILASPKAAESLKPLAELTISEGSTRLGPLSGLFSVNKSGFYLRHHLKPLGRGHGFAYWLKNPKDPPRQLEGPGYRVVETPGARPQPLMVASDVVKPDVWFFIRGNTDQDFREALSFLSELSEQHSGRDLIYLAKTHIDRSKPGKPRLALLARDHRELAAHLKRAQAGEIDRDFKPRILKAPDNDLVGDLAWVFPGSGNHYKGLGRGLAVSFPEIISLLETQTENPIGFFQSELFWEPNHKRPSVREAILAQVCFGLMSAKVLDKIDIRPQALIGYSLGEVSALVASGIWADRDELYRDLTTSTLFNGDLTGELNAPRAYWNWPEHKVLKWLSALIPKPYQQAKEALEALPPPHRHRVFILLVNTREEIVAGGEESAVNLLAQTLEAPLFPIEDVAAVHAPVVGPVVEKYSRFHTRKVTRRPDLKLYSCAHADLMEQNSEVIAESLTTQALHGHRFPDLIEKAYQDGIRFFVEVGPGNSTTRMIKAILGDRPHLAQSIAATAVDEGWTGLNRLLTELWLYGYPVAPEKTMLQPAPEPDQRYEVSINLAPPEINWPAPVLPLDLAKETQQPPEKSEDYLTWLERLSGPEKSAPERSAPDQAAPKPSSPSPAQKPDPANRPLSSVIYRPKSPATSPATSPALAAEKPAQALKPAANLSPAPLSPKASASRPEVIRRIISQPQKTSEPLNQTKPSPGPGPGRSGQNRSGFGSPRQSSPQRSSPEENPPEQNPLAQSPAPQPGPRSKTVGFMSTKGVIFDREDCLEFAVGSGEAVLGPSFAGLDSFPSRVRLPDEPLMFVDRVTVLEGQPLSRSKGRIVTEHDLKANEWCLEDGYLTPGMSIESGQADLMLSAYLGADFSTKGLANYRLLDAEVVFHDNLPQVEQRAIYDIRINNFFSHADTLMFRFEFDGSVDGKKLLSMRKGCAGFFTPKALAAGKGLGKSQPRSSLKSALHLPKKGNSEDQPPTLPGYYSGLKLGPFVNNSLRKLDRDDLLALRSGDLRPLGPIMPKVAPPSPLVLPGNRLGLIDLAREIDQKGGVFGKGFIRTEAKVDPQAWYLTSHFKGDEVMPGTLMYDGCLQSLRLLLLSRGWLGPRPSASFQPPLGLNQILRCRGQVTPQTKTIAYEVHLKDLGLWCPNKRELALYDKGALSAENQPKNLTMPTKFLVPLQPYALAEAIMFADDRPIVEAIDLGLRLEGMAPELLALLLPDTMAFPQENQDKIQSFVPEDLDDLFEDDSADDDSADDDSANDHSLNDHSLDDDFQDDEVLKAQDKKPNLFDIDDKNLSFFDAYKPNTSFLEVIAPNINTPLEISNPEDQRSDPPRKNSPDQPNSRYPVLIRTSGDSDSEGPSAQSAPKSLGQSTKARPQNHLDQARPNKAAAPSGPKASASKQGSLVVSFKDVKSPTLSPAKDNSQNHFPGPAFDQKPFNQKPLAQGPLAQAEPRLEKALPGRPGRWPKKEDFFDKNRLTEMSTGLLSNALGPLFARYDSGDFVARLPKYPYDFIDEAQVLAGQVGLVMVGTKVEATYYLDENSLVRTWLLNKAGGQKPVLPYAVINEIALQSCGFLSAYMGSALTFPGPMRFRNLGGTAITHGLVDDFSGKVVTTATLKQASEGTSIHLQKFGFSSYWNDQLIYSGQADFGFHSPDSFLEAKGLPAVQSLASELNEPPLQGDFIKYPIGMAWPEGPWRGLDEVCFDLKGQGRCFGAYHVSSNGWFFEAHFPNDPVWPGSLGLECFIQAAKVLWAKTFRPRVPLEELMVQWQAPAIFQEHRWLYRGQVLPTSKEVRLGIKITHIGKDYFTFKGLLWVDNLPVYQINDFSIKGLYF
ncbi:MAG: hypothetical protein LBE80_06375 [Deltaproteobacteria bacterium]|jgi:acyl transferase domain-containing protein/3-hydroxymyristoyl/3-hydroxydecanoyl-(acyl carrier protein) dehydratase|nr:hypothetical protein [Deltaproteobacteria bacterium]